MKLTLHVGLPKTATTYVQHTLSADKARLAERGVIYPSNSVVHHDLAKLLKLMAEGKLRYEPRLDALLAGFASEVRASGQDHLLISSEFLIETPPAAVMLLGDKLRQHFPQLNETRVLCYVREPIAFSTSFCQQALKSGHMRLSQFYDAPWPLDLRDCLSRYVDQFGRQAVEVRKFHPDSLKNGDVLDDFLDALGADELGPERIRCPLNTALSDQAVQIADALAELRPIRIRRKRYRREYRRVLESIGGDRFVLPEAVQDQVEAAAQADLAMLKAEYGVELTPVRQKVTAGPPLPAATAQSLAALIVELVERRKP